MKIISKISFVKHARKALEFFWSSGVLEEEEV